jgi:1-aminocyclopropane-1-carboxylate deaminase/D-cysteine desulfhydrase-like pyridoxal-dependent ACC family enzyme
MQLFKQLLPDAERYPTILDTQKRYHFGEPHSELLEIYQELLTATGVEFELMYDAKTWLTLKDHAFDAPVLYLHNGGISGNESMLARYRRLASQKTQ